MAKVGRPRLPTRKPTKPETSQIEVQSHFLFPEVASHIDEIDALMAEWPVLFENFRNELVQYKDIERAYQNLEEMKEILKRIIDLMYRYVPGGDQVGQFQWRQAFLDINTTLDGDLGQIKHAQKNLEFKVIIQKLKLTQVHIGGLRKKLYIVMEGGLAALKNEKAEQKKKEEREVKKQEKPVGGVVLNIPDEEGEEEDGNEEEEPQLLQCSYHDVLKDYEVEGGPLEEGREMPALELRKYPSLMQGGDTVIGVDCARMGDDKSVIVIIQGDHVVDMKLFAKTDVMAFCGRLVQSIEEYKPQRVQIEATGGLGASLYDRLRELGIGRKTRLIALETQGAASERAQQRMKSFNLRAEMFQQLEERLREGRLTLLPSETLSEELANIRYEPTSNGKFRILDKQILKKNLGRSPDCADALALASYQPVTPKIY